MGSKGVAETVKYPPLPPGLWVSYRSRERQGIRTVRAHLRMLYRSPLSGQVQVEGSSMFVPYVLAQDLQRVPNLLEFGN